MTRDESKAEAEKIVEDLTKPFLQPDFEGTLYSTVQDMQIVHCAIIHVKGIIEALREAIPELYELVNTASGTSSELVESEDVENWLSILTELNNM